MVKNVNGGSKHKSQARKNIISNKTSTALRTVENEGECYAHVEKILGGANMHVACMDGKTRLCHIRGKFRGRGKRDNRIDAGTWVMVGIRDYETVREDGPKLQNCDLLEVYKDGDKERLRNNVRADWSKFVARDMERTHAGKDAVDGETLRFITDEEEQMEKFVEESAGLIEAEQHEEEGDFADVFTNLKSSAKTNKIIGLEDDIDIDDI